MRFLIVLTFDNPDNQYFELEVYDIAGRLQVEMGINTGSVEISANKFKPGPYIYVLSGTNVEGRGKLMVH